MRHREIHMSQKTPKRIAIIGLPGSGKSTFAVELGAILHLPVHHLDKHMFEGKKKRDKQEFLSVKETLVNEQAWVIEGCSFSTLEMRFARADTVIYFHFSRLLCLWRLCKRMCTFNKKAADTGCLQGINFGIIKYIWNFDRTKRSGIEELRKRYPHVDFRTFRSQRDADAYLKNLRFLLQNRIY